MSEQTTTKTRERKDVPEEQSAAQQKLEQERHEREARAVAQKEEREAKAAERAKQQEAAKAERETKRAQEKEAREKERAKAQAEREKEKSQEREKLVRAGQLIEEKIGDEVVRTFTLAYPKKETVAERAREVIERPMGSELPVAGKELADDMGGGTVQWVAFFGMLRVMGFVKPYRYTTGNRGEGGLAYLWTGPKDLELVRSVIEDVAENESDESTNEST